MFRSLATRRRLMLAALGVAAALPALADGNEPMLTIRGELTYLQRIALPGDAVATVELKPAGAADDASATAGTRIALDGRQVPVAFSLEVPRAHLDAGTAYVLHGAIEVDSQPRWLSGPVEVDTAAASVDVGTIRLSQQQGEPATADEDDEAPSAEAIEGEWRIEDVGGETVTGDFPASIAFADGAFSGRLCNSYRGPYTLDGAAISFGNAAATLMACPEPQSRLQGALFAAFPQAKSWRVGEDGKLLVLDGDGKTLIRARR
ncbi:MAG TPA: META domain-containing protein [Aquamicrobium sp.]|nr:META domain-containing protein [Aquamicrobium sp.]